MDPLEGPTLGRRSLVAGFFATGLAVAFLWAASRAGDDIPFAPVSVAERVIRLTPGDAATFFIDKLGHLALVLLATGATLGFLAGGALLPRVVGRNQPRPYATGAAFGLLAVAASLAAPVRPPILPAILVSIVAAVLYGVCFDWIAERPQRGEVVTDRGRRAALAWAAAAALGFVAAGTLLGRIARRLAGPDTDVPIRAADVPAPLPERPSFPSIAGLSPEVTPVEDHYVVDIDLIDPVVEADGWTLEVQGLVERPAALTFSELQRGFELVEQYSVLTCITNTMGGPLVGSSRWTGVRLADVSIESEYPRTRGTLYSAAPTATRARSPWAMPSSRRSCSRSHTTAAHFDRSTAFHAACGRRRSTGLRTQSGWSGSTSSAQTSATTGPIEVGRRLPLSAPSLGSTSRADAWSRARCCG